MKYKKGDLVYAMATWPRRADDPEWVLAIVTDVRIYTLDGHASVQYKVLVVNPDKDTALLDPFVTFFASGLKPVSPGVDCGV